MTETKELFNNVLDRIAKKHLNIDTLETRNSDDLDFYDVSVWAIHCALADAFKAGLEVGLTLNSKDS